MAHAGAGVRRLRVAIGAVAGVTGGPATYVVELLQAMADLDPDDIELHVLTDRPELFAGRSNLEVHSLPLPNAWHQPLWDNVRVPAALFRIRPDIYHGTKHALPLVGLPRVASVVSIHDLAVYAEPDTFSFAQRWQLYVHLRHAARRARRVIAVSQYTADDLMARLQVPASRIDVVGHGVHAQFRPIGDPARRAVVRRHYGVEEGFLAAFVGTAQPRKRIESAIEAVGALAGEGHAIRLVIAGRRRPGYEPDWLRSPPPFVHLAGEVDASDLVELYGAADVMVSPSSFEGFGLTFVEAMACGCPVVGVAATSVPEVVGDAGILVKAPDSGQLADALRRLVTSTEVCRDYGARALRRASELSWSRAAAQTLEVYRAAHG